MNRNQIIGLAFVTIILFLVYMSFAEEEKLTLTVGGNVIEESIMPGYVFGIIEDVEYDGSKNEYYLSPGQRVTMNVRVWNDKTMPAYYKVWVYDDFLSIWIGPDVLVQPNGIEVWTFTYSAPSNEGIIPIYVESGFKPRLDATQYTFDFITPFDIVIKADAPPDPCEGVTCPSKCVGETYHYSGYCVDGDCEYKTAQTVGKCGYTLPVEEPDPEPDEPDEPEEPEGTETPTPEPEDPCEGITCPDRCVEPYTWQYDGVCVDGTCEYKEIANSADNCEYVEPTPTPLALVVSEDEAAAMPVSTPRYSTPSEVPEDVVDELFKDLPINIYGASAIGLSILGIGAYLINARRKE